MNVLDFDEFANKKQEQIDLENERQALIDFIRGDWHHVYFVKWALLDHAERVSLHPERYSAQWLELAQEVWAA
jgi:hypothetical protein